ncbi:MAG: NupC/NupG family nucleoside CNT transporter, partial [Deltaproteobacteria bacterium]|nr:NupC/NupG family nucleoside CNT transporter [Deltaproteobacteria bacterium]
MERLISLFGLFALMFMAWMASRDRKHINARLILTGLLFQCVFAFIVFKLSAGVVIFSWLNDAALKVISFAKEGIYFVFGPLESKDKTGRGLSHGAGF